MKNMPMSKACVDGDISWVKDNNIPSRKGIWGLENTTMKEHMLDYIRFWVYSLALQTIENNL